MSFPILNVWIKHSFKLIPTSKIPRSHQICWRQQWSVRLAVSVPQSCAENTGGAQPGQGQLQLAACMYFGWEYTVVAAAVKAQAGVKVADLAWQQSKEGVQGKLATHGKSCWFKFSVRTLATHRWAKPGTIASSHPKVNVKKSCVSRSHLISGNKNPRSHSTT